jgi:hypothetical protein
LEKYKHKIKLDTPMISDEEYLEQYIMHIYRFKLNQICSIKNTNLAYIAITPTLANMFGFDDAENAIGLKDEQLPCKLSDMAEVFHAQDQEVLQSQSVKYTINILDYHTGFTILKCIKEPVINPATNNILGICNYYKKFNVNTTLEAIFNIHNSPFGRSLTAKNDSNNLSLTQTEIEVLFCICLGLTNRKEIAKFLSIVHKKEVRADTTVHDAFKRLYAKLACNNQVQLLENAVKHKLHLEVPQTLLPYGSFSI